MGFGVNKSRNRRNVSCWRSVGLLALGCERLLWEISSINQSIIYFNTLRQRAEETRSKYEIEIADFQFHLHVRESETKCPNGFESYRSSFLLDFEPESFEANARSSKLSCHLGIRGSHLEVSAAVRSVFVCKYDNGNVKGDCITNLFLSPRIDRIRSIEKQS